MAKTKRSKRRQARRKYARGQRGTVVNVSKALTPIPQRYITKMKYSEIVTTDVNGQYVFNMNSLYDPNRTGTGHQPYGFDNLALLYNRYRVISCGWRATRPIVSSANPAVLLSYPSNDASITFTTLDEWKEQPRAKYLHIQPGANNGNLTGKCYLPSLMGRTKAQYMADDKYEALVNANPTEQGLLYFYLADYLGAPLTATAIHVILEFTVEWFDVKHLNQS